MTSRFFQMMKQRDGEEGFTLIEVLVSFTLLAIVTVGTVPLFVSGMKSTLVSKLDTGGKNLSQERFEQMRNLAFHVDVDTSNVPVPSNCTPAARTDPRNGAGTLECDYRDLLDTYFRSGLDAGRIATSTATAGYVRSTDARDPDEPSGVFYRFVINPVTGFSNKYSQFIATQFLNNNRAAVAPSNDYNSQISGKDFPPSRMVGVTIITKWTAGSLSKKFVSYTQIAEGKPDAPAVVGQARAVALNISGDLPDGDRLVLQAGTSNADGALASGASASVQVISAFATRNEAATGIGQRIDGISKTSTAPPNNTTTDDSKAAEELDDTDGTVLANFSETGTRDVLAAISGDQPLVGKYSGATLIGKSASRVKDPGGSGSELIGYYNRPETALITMPFLDGNRKMVRVDDTNGGTPALAAARGESYILTRGGGTHKAEAGAAADAMTVKILPTLFAPDGVIKVTLTSASLVCMANGSSTSATPSVNVTVQYWNVDHYETVNVNNLPDPTTTVVALGVTLNNYISNWSGATTPTVSSAAPNKSISAKMTVVSINTQPTRVDPNSQMGIRIGELSCLAEDYR